MPGAFQASCERRWRALVLWRLALAMISQGENRYQTDGARPRTPQPACTSIPPDPRARGEIRLVQQERVVTLVGGISTTTRSPRPVQRPCDPAAFLGQEQQSEVSDVGEPRLRALNALATSPCSPPPGRSSPSPRDHPIRIGIEPLRTWIPGGAVAHTSTSRRTGRSPPLGSPAHSATAARTSGQRLLGQIGDVRIRATARPARGCTRPVAPALPVQSARSPAARPRETRCSVPSDTRRTRSAARRTPRQDSSPPIAAPACRPSSHPAPRTAA